MITSGLIMKGLKDKVEKWKMVITTGLIMKRMEEK